jgi:hypothetical protein
MRLKYQTAIATFIQFITLAFLNIGTGAVSVVSTCRANNGNCVSNLLVSLIFFILITLWFAFVWVLGYAAQEHRSKRLAQALIVAEALIAIFALFDIKHHSDPLSLLTSFIDLCLSGWVISLAYRLMKAGGGRIVAKQSTRQRLKH